MQSADKDWSNMPMGANWQKFIGLNKVSNSEKVSEERHEEFQAYLEDFLDNNKVNHQKDFVDLLEELVVMKYPNVAQRFIRLYPEYFRPDDFRCLLAAGISAFMTNELGAAETYLRDAQILVPEEPAPYVNLCQLFWQDDRITDGLLWAKAGLDSDKNHQRLWELLAVFLKSQDESTYVDTLLLEAKKRSSWAGLSLSADLINDRDPHLKVEWLKDLYERGERGEGFLIELTAAMGTAGHYQDLVDIICREEELSPDILSWQLILHKIQGYLALEDILAAKKHFEGLECHRELPNSMKPIIVALKAEIADSLNSPVSP